MRRPAYRDHGSAAGTTGRAALQLGRRYVGIDLHPKYHDHAAKSLAPRR